MGKLEIGDLIKDGQIAELKELDATLAALLKTYTVVAIELAKGIKIEVNTPKDLEKLYELYAAQAKKAQDATEQLNETARKQEEILNKTANRIHANIETLEKENAKKREAYNVDKSALAIAMDIIGSRGQNLERLVKLDAELKSVTDAQKKLNDEEKKGSLNANDILKKREELIEKERTLKSAKSELTNILSREEKYAQSSVGSYDQLSHSLELMKRAYKQMTQEEKESSNGRILGAEIQSTDKQLKDLSSDMGEFQRNVGNYSSALDGEYSAAIKNALGLNNEFAESLLSMASDSDNGGFFEDLSTKAKSFGNTLLSFLKNPVFLSIAGISGGVAAFKFWYDYNKGLIEASKLTSQFTGLQGEDMKHYRNEVQALSDTYSQDFKETLFATNAVAKQFGIDHSEALKLVKDGFIAGADANGEFLENLKEYPAYFKEAGISASEFIAITTQANQSGIYSDKGIDVIKEGNLRIREMTTATATALDNIGISSKEVLEGLRKGELTTFDVMKKVSEKLNELPKSSSAVGTAIADIFGGPGEDAGLQYIRTLKDISTNLDDVKGKAGKLGEVQEDLLTSQVELANAVADLFDSTGGFFETLTAKGKIFTNDVLKDILNYINQITSSADELGKKRLEDAKIQGEAAAKEDIHWQEQKRAEIERTAKAYIKSGVDETVAYQKAKDEQLAILQRSRQMDKDELDSYIAENKKVNENADNASLWRQMIGSEQTNAEYRDQINKTFNLIEYRTASLASADYKIGFIENIDYKPKPDATSGKTKEQIKAEQDAAKKALKIRRDLEESKIEIMNEGIGKEIAKIELSYQKRIDAITGNSNSEITLRANLEKQKEKALSQYNEEYNKRFEKTNLENRLSSVEKNTKEELGLKMQLLNIEEKAEIKAAEITGADILLIEQKYHKKREELNEEFSISQIQLIAENAAAEQIIRDQDYQRDMLSLKKQLAQKKITKEEYAEQEYLLSVDYARKTTEAAIDALEVELAASSEGSDERSRIAEELQNKKAELANKTAELEIEAIDRVTEKDDEAKKKRMRNLQDWLQLASDAVGSIGDLIGTIYDGKIAKIEDEQEVNDEVYDRDIERIENLAETGAISEEEAEIRKRAAEDKTAAKNAELEKKKQAMAKKQATWDKATSIAQAGIATALGITKALPNFILAAIVGAMGAIQIATIAATPIPSYAEGTKNGSHPGGKALVGDASKREVVMYNGLAWITPDTPMMVDLPRGAKVFPDVGEMETLDWNSLDSEMSFMNHKFMGSKQDIERTTVINDFSRLERKMEENNRLMDATNRLITQRIKQQRKYDVDRDFELYKLKKL